MNISHASVLVACKKNAKTYLDSEILDVSILKPVYCKSVTYSQIWTKDLMKILDLGPRMTYIEDNNGHIFTEKNINSFGLPFISACKFSF